MALCGHVRPFVASLWSYIVLNGRMSSFSRLFRFRFSLFLKLKIYVKLSTDVAPSTLLSRILLEVSCRGRSFKVNQSALDVIAIFKFSIETIINAQSKVE